MHAHSHTCTNTRSHTQSHTHSHTTCTHTHTYTHTHTLRCYHYQSSPIHRGSFTTGHHHCSPSEHCPSVPHAGQQRDGSDTAGRGGGEGSEGSGEEGGRRGTEDPCSHRCCTGIPEEVTANLGTITRSLGMCCTFCDTTDHPLNPHTHTPSPHTPSHPHTHTPSHPHTHTLAHSTLHRH